MVEKEDIVWVNQPGNKGAARVHEITDAGVIVRFLEPGRGEDFFTHEAVEKLDLPALHVTRRIGG